MVQKSAKKKFPKSIRKFLNNQNIKKKVPKRPRTFKKGQKVLKLATTKKCQKVPKDGNK